MQLTTYILATAMALSSGAFAIDIDIAYTSDGVGHTQTVQTDLQVPLDYPGYISTFQANQTCYLNPGGRIIDSTYLPPGANVLDPAVEAAVIMCFGPQPPA
ncbi:short chain dehydrogenase family protein [Aspergillus tubingensis]|uniref:Uncharacterized protein n=2 Tax=Aspergillus subgen. Circumdati TaxID=2720871 RepID=A0A1L9NE36_ASPTC|nr:short chain dehydrogenase family protein [Aspergillus tubingensis]OJI87529.1 hypothetical protein ASPTUDRAFT_196967 [Aspergillus tubingensis CBS 134.48]GAQ46884.1 hypothetical protein ABL_09545 [Aspergillus niger]GFN19437.1 short chain dehydrogenase family protein [Aspergillus tubingensis]